MTADCVKTYALQIDRFGNIVGEDNADPRGEEFDKIVRHKMAEHGISYEQAFEMALSDPDCSEAVRRYGSS